ncbi:hypothetical protein H0H92_005285 [Tricholoma furcatifolium]|nr:hypothetical protein H0H92_005285 [Tricholoma furcatifolium]
MAQTENPCTSTQEESPPGTCVAAGEIPAAPMPRREYEMDEDVRRQKLEDDEWTVNVQPKSVRCQACSRNITLDSRRMYYPTNWNRHRGRCRKIKTLTGVSIPKVRQLCQTWYGMSLTAGYPIQIQRTRRARAAPKRSVVARTAPACAIAVDENGRGALSTEKDDPWSEASKQGTSVTDCDIIPPDSRMDSEEEPTYDTESRALLITGKQAVSSTTMVMVIALSQYPEEPHNWHRELEVELLDSDDDDDEDMLPLPPLREATWGSVYDVRETVETLEANRRKELESSSGRNRDVSTEA